MEHYTGEKKTLSTGIWVMMLIGAVVITLSLCGGAAYTAVRSARLSAAKSSIGHIEAVLLLAEASAEREGLGAAPDAYDNLLKSYIDGTPASYTTYEKYILSFMQESFGSQRDFDFAVTRYRDGSGTHTQVYFFPSLGRTNMKRDRYYVLTGGTVNEYNE